MPEAERELLRDTIHHLCDPQGNNLLENGAACFVTTQKVLFIDTTLDMAETLALRIIGREHRGTITLDVSSIDRCIEARTDDSPTHLWLNAKNGHWDVYFDTEEQAARFKWVVNYAMEKIRRMGG